MNKADITRILEGVELTDAQVKALLDINSADITKALGKQKDELTAANDALTEARKTISDLEANKGDTEALQKQIDAYRAADEQRKADEKAAAERAELMERMDAVLDGRKFIHDRLKDPMLEDFKAAIADKANRGKSDKEIFEAMTQDKGYFASQNPGAGSGGGENMGGFGNIDEKISNKADFFKLSFEDQMKFKETRAAEFKQLFNPAPIN